MSPTAGKMSGTATQVENSISFSQAEPIPIQGLEKGPILNIEQTSEDSGQEKDTVNAYPELAWSKVRHYMREPFSEFFGVFILILFGDGVVAQVVLSDGKKGDYQSISWGWG